MRNLTKNLGKLVDTKDLSNLPRRVKHWDLMFVDDHGRVITFQHIKRWVVFFMIVLLFSLVVSIYLYTLYKSTEKKTLELQNAIEVSRQDAAAMQQEMHMLMVRLAEAQSKIPKTPSKKGTPARKSAPGTKKTKPSVIKFAKTETAPKNPALSRQKASKKIVPPKKPAVSSSEAGRQAVPQQIEVGVFDFSASHDPEKNVLAVRFILKNINRNIPEIAGHIFIIMKEHDDDSKEWLSIPDATLVSGKPHPVKAGHFFKIRNYKTIELQSGPIARSRSFRKASVLVFSSTGKLVMQKTYRVNIDMASPEEVPPAVTVTDTSRQKPVTDLQRQDKSPLAETKMKSESKKSDPENIIPEETSKKINTENTGQLLRNDDNP
jgi:hypothetical protein